MTRILIVEDEADIQELLDAYLRDAGYDTALAGDGIEAAALFQRERFDLVLLDVMLPKLDGWGVRAHPPPVPGAHHPAHRPGRGGGAAAGL